MKLRKRQTVNTGRKISPEALTQKLRKKGYSGVTAAPFRNSIRLEGQVPQWEDKIQAGYLAANQGYKGVVNDITVDGVEELCQPELPALQDDLLEGREFDVVIIGGGVTGCALARELSRHDISIALLEKEEDLACHASSRNDGMIHPAFAAKPGSLKAHYNARGNRLYDTLCRELGVAYQKPGNIILFDSPGMFFLAPVFLSRARKNGDKGCRVLSRKEVFRREPHANPRQRGGFYLPNAGVLSPYQLTIALGENAVQNGASLFFQTQVTGFEMKAREKGGQRIARVKTNRGTLKARVVVNAAGIWADRVAEYADDRFFSLHGRKGVDMILDLKTGKRQKHITALLSLKQLGGHTKGGGIVPAVEGNLLIGPTAREVPEKEDYSTRREDIDDLIQKMEANLTLKPSEVITYFAGIRACTYEEDFIVEPSERVENLVHVAGIQSPGLASAPAIAQDAAAMAVTLLGLEKRVHPNRNFNPQRPGRPLLNSTSREEWAALVRKDPAYGRIVCRCETISEGEIRDALTSPLPVSTVDGVKRRTRAGMGRCHGGFCTPRIMEIMAAQGSQGMTAITKKGRGSEILTNPTKEAHYE